MSILTESLKVQESAGKAEYVLIEEGLYQAVCVGVVAAMKTKYQSEEQEEQVRFVYQVHAGDIVRLMSTRWFKPSLNEKSNSYKFFSKLTRASNPTDCLAKLTELCGGEFTMERMVGTGATCYVVTKNFNGADGEQVEYNDIESFSPGKTKVQTQKGFIPAWVAKSNPTGVIWNSLITEFEERVEQTKNAVDPVKAEKVMDKSVEPKTASQATSDTDDFFNSIS